MAGATDVSKMQAPGPRLIEAAQRTRSKGCQVSYRLEGLSAMTTGWPTPIIASDTWSSNSSKLSSCGVTALSGRPMFRKHNSTCAMRAN